MKITKSLIKRIANDPAAVRTFYEGKGFFCIFEDGTYGVIQRHDDRNDIVSKVLCPSETLETYLVNSFLDKTVIF